MIARRNLLFRHLGLILLSLIMIYPVIWWIGASLKSNQEMSLPNLFPANPLWSNFKAGWYAIPGHSFTDFYLNNLQLELGILITTVISCSLVAFGFARLDFPLRNFWFAILMLTLMLPGQVTIIPQYALFHSLGWVNTYLPFIVPHSLAGGAGGAFFVFLLIQFIRGIPKELDESAKIDGCSWFGIYWRIVLPLTKPALVTVLIYCNSVDKYTVGLALRMFNDSQSVQEWGQLLAMGLVSVIPSVIIFFLAQKHFVEGIATSGIKG
jgi:ABC-type glycerol-3-phosphate transport system permease component